LQAHAFHGSTKNLVHDGNQIPAPPALVQWKKSHKGHEDELIGNFWIDIFESSSDAFY